MAAHNVNSATGPMENKWQEAKTMDSATLRVKLNLPGSTMIIPQQVVRDWSNMKGAQDEQRNHRSLLAELLEAMVPDLENCFKEGIIPSVKDVENSHLAWSMMRKASLKQLGEMQSLPHARSVESLHPTWVPSPPRPSGVQWWDQMKAKMKASADVVSARRRQLLTSAAFLQLHVREVDFSIFIRMMETTHIRLSSTAYLTTIMEMFEQSAYRAAVYKHATGGRSQWEDQQHPSMDTPIGAFYHANAYPMTIHPDSMAMVWNKIDKCWTLVGYLDLGEDAGYAAVEICHSRFLTNNFGEKVAVTSETDFGTEITNLGSTPADVDHIKGGALGGCPPLVLRMIMPDNLPPTSTVPTTSSIASAISPTSSIASTIPPTSSIASTIPPTSSIASTIPPTSSIASTIPPTSVPTPRSLSSSASTSPLASSPHPLPSRSSSSTSSASSPIDSFLAPTSTWGGKHKGNANKV